MLANDSGRLEAEGAWRVLGRAQQTKLDIILDAKDAGGFLVTFGYRDTVQGARTVSIHCAASAIRAAPGMTTATPAGLSSQSPNRMRVSRNPRHWSRTQSRFRPFFSGSVTGCESGLR